MDTAANAPPPLKADEEQARRLRRFELRDLNVNHTGEGMHLYWYFTGVYMFWKYRYAIEPSKALDSSLKRHTAFIKRMRQSLVEETPASGPSATVVVATCGELVEAEISPMDTVCRMKELNSDD